MVLHLYKVEREGEVRTVERVRRPVGVPEAQREYVDNDSPESSVSRGSMRSSRTVGKRTILAKGRCWRCRAGAGAASTACPRQSR